MEETITQNIQPLNRMSRMRLHAQSLAQPINPEGLSYLDDLYNTAALDWGIGQSIQTLAIRAKRGAMFQDDLQGYNPYTDEDFSDIDPQYYREFLDARTPEQFLAVKDMIETNTRRRRELDQNNAFITRLIGNALNPSILIPVPFARGIGFREGFKKTAPVIGGILGTEEYLRHELDPTSTVPETLFTIGGGTLFGGALGGLAGMVGSKTIGRTTKQWFEDHQKIVETANRLEDEMPGVTDGIRPQTEFKTTVEYQKAGSDTVEVTEINRGQSKTDSTILNSKQRAELLSRLGRKQVKVSKYLFHVTNEIDEIIEKGLTGGGLQGGSPITDIGFGRIVHVFRRSDFDKKFLKKQKEHM